MNRGSQAPLFPARRRTFRPLAPQLGIRRALPLSPRRPAAPEPGFVYLLCAEMGGLYKIGRTGNVPARVRQLNALLPFDVVVIHTIRCRDTRRLEAVLKAHYAHRRVKGEWFALAPEDVAQIVRVR